MTSPEEPAKRLADLAERNTPEADAEYMRIQDEILAESRQADPAGNNSTTSTTPEILPAGITEEEDQRALELLEQEDRLEKIREHERTRQGSLNIICREYERTDIGNADRLKQRYGHIARYCFPFESWYLWDGCKWARDLVGGAQELGKDTAIRIKDEAGKTEGEIARSEMYRHAVASQARKNINSLLALAKSSLPIVPDAMDANKNLLNFRNGTLELDTLAFRDHRKEDLCTKATGCSYDPAAECPTWLSFLNDVMGADQDLISFLQRSAGYTLTTHTGERVIFLCYGAGANGKSTFLNTIDAALGDYGVTVASDTFTVKRGDTIRNDIARLKGARLVCAIEAGKGKRLDESLVKAMTGNDPISARFLHQEFFTFKPECKIWWAFNSKPRITDTTRSIWDRILLIPFEVRIPAERRDKDLPEKLLAELPGIMNWMIEGLKEYRIKGLAAPEKVTAATEEYQEESDILGDFLEEMCIINPGYAEPALKLHEAYKQWASFNCEEHPLGFRRFLAELEDHDFKKYKGRDGATKDRVMFKGLKLKSTTTLS